MRRGSYRYKSFVQAVEDVYVDPADIMGLRVAIFRMIVLVIVISATEHFTHTQQAPPPRVETNPMPNARRSDTNNNTNIPRHKLSTNPSEANNRNSLRIWRIASLDV
jgi:hypothetical protein